MIPLQKKGSFSLWSPAARKTAVASRNYATRQSFDYYIKMKPVVLLQGSQLSSISVINWSSKIRHKTETCHIVVTCLACSLSRHSLYDDFHLGNTCPMIEVLVAIRLILSTNVKTTSDNLSFSSSMEDFRKNKTSTNDQSSCWQRG